MDYENEIAPDSVDTGVGGEVQQQEDEAPESDRKLVARILRTIKGDKQHHEKAFKRMTKDMQLAFIGADTTNWDDKNYRANLAGRVVKQKVAALYAKNPKAIARRPERLDFALWDESPETLMQAFQTVQVAQQAAMMAPPTIDPMGNPAPPMIDPAAQQAQAILDDFQQGMQLRQTLDRFAKTLEILFGHAMRTQQPVDFKTAMKQVVRRAATTAVGYVKPGYVRDMGPREGLNEQIVDHRQRIEHLQRLMDEAAEGEIEPVDAEMRELEASLAALQAEPDIVVSEGLVFDFPKSTKVIPDRRCKSLIGFVGADHVAVEYDYTPDQIREIFGVDLGKNYQPYKQIDELNVVRNDDYDIEDEPNVVDGAKDRSKDLVRVWEYYDKPSGLVYYVADGYLQFLREPAPPDVFVEQFFPIYALTFNDVESETELFPPSDVSLMRPMQEEHNRSRQGKREHRNAARPRWAFASGAIGDEEKTQLSTAKPFEAVGLNLPPGAKLNDVLQPIPVPGVDPNLYDTNEVFTDMQLVIGMQESVMGGLAKATATESSIAASAASATDSAAVDDLDSFLTRIARDCGVILQREMPEEQVIRIVGPGAVWPTMELGDMAEQIYLEVEAGSTGRPNKAAELDNWKTMLPFLLQMPGIVPEWLAKESLKRLDDRMDLTGALVQGLPAIMAMNRMSQPALGDPAAAPDQQGAEGADKNSSPQGEDGSEPAFGSNQT